MIKIRAAVAGASGLVGGCLLRRLLADPLVERVFAPTRRPLPAHPKLVNPIIKISVWPTMPALDEAYCTLGTTRAKARSEADFRAVDLELTRAFVLAAKAAGAKRFGLVSSAGAKLNSRFLYPRVKAQAEAVASAAGFESVVIVRPSLLLGRRTEHRPLEKTTASILAWLEPILGDSLRRWRGVPADVVASALIKAARGRVPGTLVLESELLSSI